MKRRIFRQAGSGISSVCFPDVTDGVPAAQPGQAQPGEGPLSAAESRARAIVAQASAEAELIRAAAREEGRAQAMGMYEEPLRAALAAVKAVKESLESAGPAAAAGAEKELVRLVVRIAEKVIRRKLASDGDEVFLMISRAIQAVPKGRSLLIRVNEKDYESIQKAGEVIPTAAKLAGSLSLEVSGDVEPGGCVVITEAGAVNANPSSQLELIEEALLKEIPGGL
jgi:flagellar assembly protein FliH